MGRVHIFLYAFFCFWISVSVADVRRSKPVYTQAEFTQLAEELSHKVNLFRDAWKLDPDAEFFGGTTRDYLYWLKGKLNQAKSRTEYRRIVKKLRSHYMIDVKSFIIGESDVDIISKKHAALNADTYGVKKIDFISADRFDPSTEMGQNELKQGHIPVEKIRLGKNGFVRVREFGNGIKEVYSGKITVHFPSQEAFESTYYAGKKLNHPVLLVIRYLRMVAVDYFKTYGADFPDLDILFSYIDEPTRKRIEKIVATCLNGRELLPHLENKSFARWMNGLLAKAYRAYTNQTAANELLKEFKVLDLVRVYEAIKPVNQYLFVKVRNKEVIAANIKASGITTGKLYTKITSVLKSRKLYHGTPTESNFRGILLQGFRPSEGGMGGRGLYGFSSKDKKEASEWKGAGDKVVVITLKPDAVFVDLTREGPAKKLFERLGLSHDEFAERFGVDVIRYKMGNVNAFVVKNASVIEHCEGLYRTVLTFSKASAMAGKISSAKEAFVLLKSIMLTGFSRVEKENLVLEMTRNMEQKHGDKKEKIKAIVAQIYRLMDKEFAKRTGVEAEDIARHYREKTLFPSTYRPSLKSMVEGFVRLLEMEEYSVSEALGLVMKELPEESREKRLFIQVLRKFLNHRQDRVAGLAAHAIIVNGKKSDIDAQVLEQAMKILKTNEGIIGSDVVKYLKEHMVPNEKNLKALIELMQEGKRASRNGAKLLAHFGRNNGRGARFFVNQVLGDRSKNYTVARMLIKKILADITVKSLKPSVGSQWKRGLQHPDPEVVIELAIKLMRKNVPLDTGFLTPNVKKWLWQNLAGDDNYSRLLMHIAGDNPEVVEKVIQSGNISWGFNFVRFVENIMVFPDESIERIRTLLIERMKTMKLRIKIRAARALIRMGTAPVRLIPILESFLNMGLARGRKKNEKMKILVKIADMLLNLDPENRVGREFIKESMMNEWNSVVLESATLWYRLTGEKEKVLGILEREMANQPHTSVLIRLIKAILMIDPNHEGALDKLLGTPESRRHSLVQTTQYNETIWNVASAMLDSGSLNSRILDYARTQLGANRHMMAFYAAMIFLRKNPYNQEMFERITKVIEKGNGTVRDNVFRRIENGFLGHPVILKALAECNDRFKVGDAKLLLRKFTEKRLTRETFQRKIIIFGKHAYKIKGHDKNTLFLEGIDTGEDYVALMCRPGNIIQKFVELDKAGVGPEAVVHYGVNFVVHKKITGETASDLIIELRKGGAEISDSKAEALEIMLLRLLKQGIYSPQNNLVWTGKRWQIRDARNLRTGVSIRKLKGRYEPALKILRKSAGGQRCKITGELLFELGIQ